MITRYVHSDINFGTSGKGSDINFDTSGKGSYQYCAK